MHPRLSELRDHVDAQRSALLSAAAAVPAERWTEQPAPGRWSLVDLFEHLYRVEHGCARLIARAAAEARAAGHPAETETGSLLGILDRHALRDRSEPREAPERVAPAGGWSREEALERLAASRAELHAAMQEADGLALGTIRRPHLRLGDLDLYAWIMFVGEHEARHVEQAAEIAAQVGAIAR